MLEHVNLTVKNPEATAKLLCELFGWHVRWQGHSALGGRTVHVGTDTHYLAVYTAQETPATEPSEVVTTTAPADTYRVVGGLNHLGIVVDDLDATETRVKAAGFATYNHGDYEPGRRFYFDDTDGIEFEVVSYAA